MNIIIDTNIFFSDWTLHTDDAVNFLAFVERTASKIYLPRIVWEEIGVNYRNEIIKKYKTCKIASKILKSNLMTKPEFEIFSINYDEVVEDYLNKLKLKLRFNDIDNILPYGDYTERIANRVMAKRRPFNMQNHNEYKDTLVWETVLDMVSGKI